jgi:predicted XRE-type DNA-binding protein
MAKQDLTFLNISQMTIQLLEQQGMSQTEIAEFLEVSKSFISRVKGGTRSFTLQHLTDVGEKFDEPLSLLLFRMTPPESIKPEHRRLYNIVKRMIEPKPVRKKKTTTKQKKSKAA